MEHSVGKPAELTFLGGRKRLLFCFLLDVKRDVYCGQCCSWHSLNTEGSRLLADKATKVEHEMLQTQLQREGEWPGLRNCSRAFIVSALLTLCWPLGFTFTVLEELEASTEVGISVLGTSMRKHIHIWEATRQTDIGTISVQCEGWSTFRAWPSSVCTHPLIL